MSRKKIHLNLTLLASTVVLDAEAVNEEVTDKEEASKEVCEDGTMFGGITPPEGSTPPPQEDKEIICHWMKDRTFMQK